MSLSLDLTLGVDRIPLVQLAAVDVAPARAPGGRALVAGTSPPALKEYRTQMGTWDPTEMITMWARQQGSRRKIKAAESYRLMRLHEP